MADSEMKAVGLKLKVDGTVDFKKSLTEVNNAVNENRSAFKLAKSEWDKSTSSAEKLRTTQEYLQNSLMGGGEAGKEAVLPIKLLKDYIREENDANNATLAAMIVEAFKSISMTAENNIYIGDKKSITLLTNLVLKQMANKTLATQGAKGK